MNKRYLENFKEYNKNLIDKLKILGPKYRTYIDLLKSVKSDGFEYWYRIDKNGVKRITLNNATIRSICYVNHIRLINNGIIDFVKWAEDNYFKDDSEFLHFIGEKLLSKDEKSKAKIKYVIFKTLINDKI